MPESGAQPRVWIVDAYRAGEQTQLRALAEGLGWPFEIKTLSYRKYEMRTTLLRGHDLRGVELATSDALAPPWPDLVLSMGMRNEPVCRWVREQSGGRTKLVFLGRLWSDPSHFDLVITTPQYRVPDRPNVLRNALPLHPVGPARLAEARALWAPHLTHLQGPFITVNIGGTSGPYAFGRRAADRLVRDAVALAKARGASLLVSSSARTPDCAIDAFAAQDAVPMALYRWRRGDGDNPYLGYLAMADEVIVTADSISMLSEAYATAKPVHMFDTGAGRLGMRHDMHLAAGETATARMQARQDSDRPDIGSGALAYRALMRWGWRHLTRDISQMHLRLVRSGRMGWLGDPPPTSDAIPPSDLQRAVARIRDLMGVDGARRR
ncbi:mitochondrial fission ELM1 family protein [Roseovarius sp. D22-M7]|uniref:mitochondrial fission ELM1 family protein n=1 Tax=Roseovarius sp. D22-M7 TaxID=3127116 RepID=UPI00300FB60F